MKTAAPTMSGRLFFMVRRHLPWLLATLLVLLTILAYLPGIGGPFLFDDTPNIVLPLNAWLQGSSDWLTFVLGNHSGPLGRVVSMLTFAANGATTGLAAWPFKLTNLAIHILCGGLIYILLARLLRHDRILGSRARIVAGLIAAIWLLHPLQVSTVLYVVQRMAQLSTLFMLLALWAFVSGREALLAGRLRQAWLRLFIMLPACTVLAMASKENGVLVLVLCAVLELAYFRPLTTAQGASAERAKWTSQLFFYGVLVLPILGAAIFLLLNPSFYLGGYDGRLFTLSERLLSEPRALLDYVGLLILPRGAAMGLYTDDFAVSHSLFDPPSTLWAMLGLGAWMLASVLLRKRAPAFFAGTWFYLGGHALESTIFPLELYFEHRNYLPSIGVFLAVAGLLGLILPRLRARLPEGQKDRVFIASAGLIIVLLASATAVRSKVWSSWPSIVQQGIQAHPMSRRAHFDKIAILLAHNQPEAARATMVEMLHLPDPAAYHAAALNIVWLDCREQGIASPADVARLNSLIGAKVQLDDFLGSEMLGKLLLQQECKGLPKQAFADILRKQTAASGQHPSDRAIWRLRYMAARLYLGENMVPEAIAQTNLAWASGAAEPPVGILLLNLYYATGNYQDAETLLPKVRARIPDWDRSNQDQLSKVLRQYEPPHGS